MMVNKLVLGGFLLSMMFFSCKTKEEKFFVLKSPQETGVLFSNQITTYDSFNILTFEYIYNGAGVGIADFNNDGLQDLFFAGNQVPNKLYLNKGDFKFSDVSQEAKINIPGKWNSGVTVVDINNDNLMDVFVCATANPDPELRKDMLFVNMGINNDGVPVFVDKAKEFGIDYDGHSTMAAFLDYDLDGDLDLYILVNQKLLNVPSNYRPKIKDGSAANNDRLYRNNGNLTFTDVTKEAGIVYEGYGLGLAVTDVNADGWPDLYVSNDYQSNDILYLNQKNGTFKNSTTELLSHQSQFSMGNDAADINNDGRTDIITLDMLPETNARKKTTIGNKSYLTYLNNDKFEYEYQFTRNMLHVNNGAEKGIKFSEVGMLAGVYQTEWSWSPLFADFDNDGNKDLAITNGFPKDITDKDFANYRADVGNIATPAMLVDSIPVIKIPNYVYRNKGDLTFEDVTDEWGLGLKSFSNGAAFGDLDNDGDLDYVVNNIDDPAFIFENTLYTSGKNQSDPEKEIPSFLRVKLKGEPSNVNALGAKLSVFYDHGKMQYFENSVYRGFLSSVEGIAHFGLKKGTTLDSLLIVWPNGKRQKVINPGINQVLEISYQPTSEPKSLPVNESLLTEVSENLGIAINHSQSDVIDFNFQRTIPHKYSQPGPGLAVSDLNNDGLDDFIIGGSAGFDRMICIQKKDGTFSVSSAKKSLKNLEEDTGILLFDANNDGYQDLYAVSGGFHDINGSPVYQDNLYINDKKGGLVWQKDALPEMKSSGSCVRASDFDGDGDLDLFVGGRVVPHSFPLPASSYILKNEGGKFRNATEEVCKSLIDYGLVTDAVWTDFDNDGHTDLFIVGEFLPLTFFRNEHNKLVRHPVLFNKNLKGLWNSIAAEDFDRDGDIDYVIGNQGLNNPFNATAKRPLTVVGKDVDGNGSIDPVVACYMRESMDSKEMKLYPVHFWDEINTQSPKFRNKFARYKDYSKVTLFDLFTPDELDKAILLEANTLSSTYIENLGGGNFSVHQLPMEAQISPIYGMVVTDVNQDLFPDILMVGNDYGAEVFYGRYDAFNGLVLTGNGKGGFAAVPALESGLIIDGDAKACASIKVGNSIVYLASQNKDSLKAYASFKVLNDAEFTPGTTDVYAWFTDDKGKRYKKEFYHGCGYLSQSSRKINIPSSVVEIEIFDSKNSSRKIKTEALRKSGSTLISRATN